MHLGKNAPLKATRWLHPMYTQTLKHWLQQTSIAHTGHFLYESGHHGDIWLELEKIVLDPKELLNWVQELAKQIEPNALDFICGPALGGAFVAQLLAFELDCGFIYSERSVLVDSTVKYSIPTPIKPLLNTKRVLIVDDAINAGSAALGTMASLTECGASLVGIASLITTGQTAFNIALEHHIPYYTLLTIERNLWLPSECPLCMQSLPITHIS